MFEDKIFSSKKYQYKYTELIELEEKLEIDKSRISDFNSGSSVTFTLFHIVNEFFV